jgi:hypothetical protein
VQYLQNDATFRESLFIYPSKYGNTLKSSKAIAISRLELIIGIHIHFYE